MWYKKNKKNKMMQGNGSGHYTLHVIKHITI